MSKSVPPSFESFYRQSFGPLVRSLALVAPSTAAGADAAQDAFLAALKEWDKIGSYDLPEAWVRRVALNRLANERRSVRRRDRAVDRAGLLLSKSTETAVDAQLDLLAAIRDLPRRQREVTALYYVADLPVEEIAEILEISSGAVKSHLHDARQRLGRDLGSPAETRDSETSSSGHGIPEGN